MLLVETPSEAPAEESDVGRMILRKLIADEGLFLKGFMVRYDNVESPNVVSRLMHHYFRSWHFQGLEEEGRMYSQLSHYQEWLPSY